MLAPRYRIVIIGLHYAPESTGNAPYTTNLAEGLRSAGHDVHVITGYPHYPEWKIKEGYSGWSRSESIHGVSLARLRHFVPARPNFLNRLHMEISFGLRAVFAPWGKPDVVLLVSPALFACALITLRTRLSRTKAKVAIWTQDLYSRGLVEVGKDNKVASILSKAMAALESTVLGSADEVVAIHERFRTYMVDHLKLSPTRITVIRNWTHLPPSPTIDRPKVRRKLGWGETELIALHAGNMGKKQGLANLIEAARLAEETGSRVRFVLMGDGNQRKRLQSLAQGLANISFIDPLPQDEFQQALCAADVLLINELPGVRDMSVPSKMTSYFNAARPIVAATDQQSVSAEELASAEAGLQVPPGDPGSLLRALEKLTAAPEKARQMGERGLQFRQETLSQGSAIARYDEFISKMASSRDQ